ncbi:lytic transglycosylase domain-containing protein [Piscinibacter sp. XHJ-5]|uniref:lytic transglycosylase domain-containing protein n=1 Tax=Piscinibacter sp. XHJ-5 TaxID=3037797 RepID=UPI002452DE4E|nr:lytic transglycosylase domain-containing protein [Piscinibacter sp. XHJ-5]
MKLPADDCEPNRFAVPRATHRRGRAACRLAAAAALLAASPLLPAQPCMAPLSAALAASAAAASAEKFKLIAQQCDVLAEPAQVHRAAQLGLYERGAPVAVAMPSSPAPDAAASAPAAPAAPLTGDAARVLSLAPALINAAQEHDIDPLLLHAVAHVESRHNARAVSPAGARGVMQVMPATAKRFGVDQPERQLFDAATNARAAAAYLRTLRSRYGDDLRLVLAAYNAGEGAVAKHGGNVPPYPETQAYVRDVLAVYRRLTSEFSVSASGRIVARGSRS